MPLSIPSLFRRYLVLVPLAAGSAAADTVTLPAVRDNTLCEDATGTRSNGAGIYIFVGRTNNSVLRRGLVGFDVSSLPAGSLVNSVSVSLNLSRTVSAAQPIALHRVTAGWGEGTSDAGMQEGRCAAATPGDATWIHRVSPLDLWTTPGGDFAPAASATRAVNDVGPYTWPSTPELVADVQSWIDVPGSGHGWVLVGNEQSDQSAKRFDSRDNPDSSVRPALTIDYTPPVAVNPTVYEHTAPDPCLIIVPANAIGTGMNGLQFTPGAAPLLFYQVDQDGSCATSGPQLLRMVKAGTRIDATF